MLRYIHRSPIRAGMCTNPENYRWTSHFFYKNSISNSFINTGFILGIFSRNIYISIKQYYDLMNFKGDDNDKKNYFNMLQETYSYSTNKKIKQIVETSRKEIPTRIEIDKIFDNTVSSQSSKELILKKSQVK